MDVHFKMEMQWRESWEGHIIPALCPAVVLFRNDKLLMQSKSKLMIKHVGIWFCKSEEKFTAGVFPPPREPLPITVSNISSLLLHSVAPWPLLPTKSNFQSLAWCLKCSMSWCGTGVVLLSLSSQLAGVYLGLEYGSLLLLSMGVEGSLQLLWKNPVAFML